MTSEKIAGNRTDKDWLEIRGKLIAPGSDSVWLVAFEDFFYQRLVTRYLEPIRLLHKHGGNNGVGFSIVSIQCTLIEFLQTTRDGTNFEQGSGKIYSASNDGSIEIGKKYDGSSKEIFTRFLKDQAPFKEIFGQNDLADLFFKNVRCGLLHEARTCGKWRITAAPHRLKIVDTDGEGATKWLQRDRLQEALEAYIFRYKVDLLANEFNDSEGLKAAFIAKFDALAGIADGADSA
jgi:hypothetical protein